ncbi:MAG: PASTA domain-containing protein [Gracilibacteraceae bacterium]|jgi:cell division protein FtsI/penicillin-binding protein 2|nr:PASTA domain-containing protein [Gracilibacteraceae bacterium]
MTRGEKTYFGRPSPMRARFVYCLIAVAFLFIAGRLLYLQVLGAADIRLKAENLRQISRTANVSRGAIVDVQGNILASSFRACNVFVDPKYLHAYLEGKANSQGLTVDGLANALAQILGAEAETIKSKLETRWQYVQKGEELVKTDVEYVMLARQMPTDIAERLRQADKTLLGISSEEPEASKVFNLLNAGIGVENVYKRLYPKGGLGAGVIGFVNDNGNGGAGVEAYYNDILNGRPDPGDDLPSAANGYTLRLTLDATIQYLLERELDAAIAECQPARACALALDPMSGRILAMASRPTFDPAEFALTAAENHRNLPTGMTYEPGSTFKIITAATAIEEQIVGGAQLFSDPGSLTVGPDTIVNWDSAITAHGDITLTQAMMDSSNVVFGQVGMLIGRDLFRLYLKGFGFGEQTGVDLGGEEKGMLVPGENIRSIDMVTMAFGQANLVTPLQLLSAVCAVANGGYLYQPYLLDAVLDSDGREVQRTEPQIKRQVISTSTAREVTAILEKVVESGTGSRVKIPGIRVAGKTGTAQKIDPEDNRYSEDDFIVSFLAFAPAERPRIAVLFIIDSPRGVKPQGGVLAGPRVKNILEGTLQYYGIPVDAQTPDHLEEWRNDLARTTAAQATIVQAAEPLAPPGEGETAVPSLIGLTMAQVGETLAGAELLYTFEGSGLAVEQLPLAGTIVNRGDTVKVVFGE